MPLLALFAMLQQGTPSAGPAPYWQQRVVYDITARLDEPTATLGGSERVRYINRSPDTLRTISFHLYLNAFRPGSRWSTADAAEDRHRFDTLKEPNFGFNHVRNVTIAGTVVTPVYPFGEDSTIVRFALPQLLAPGDSIDVTMDWDARPSIPPRRQGRRGRSYDFAQWYPKVVVYDKYGWEEHALYPAGEFYGEFGDFDVVLDVPKDQVVAATGVPVCGDPGWKGANRGPGQPETGAGDSTGVTGTYPGARARFLCNDLEGPPLGPTRDPNRKLVHWVAHDVHNFAISMSPDYRYEGGSWNGIQVHVLYQPGDDSTWGHGIVVKNTITMLQWMHTIFGKYPWPQMTVVHRIEGGGTEFPMMEMNGSPSLGLNLHEGGHTYLMGILANNEWREGWMDEGFTSFQTSWFESLQARNDGAIRNTETNILLDDLDGQSQPIETVSEKFRDFNTYNNMIYTRGELFLHELRRMVGDSLMVEILHRYYQRWALHHVDEDAFKAVVEEVTHRDMSTFFAQWLHAVTLTDYAVGRASRRRTDSGWTTTIRVDRRAPGIYPVTVAVMAEHDTAMTTIDGVDEQRTIAIATRSRPIRVEVDPFEYAHDWNMLNNQWNLSFWTRLTSGNTPARRYLDTYFDRQSSRDQLTVGIMPQLWFNDAGGLTLGLQTHSDYLGRFQQETTVASCSTGGGATVARERRECNFSTVLRNPAWWRAPNLSQTITAFRTEGRAGGGLALDQAIVPHVAFGPQYHVGVSANWTATYDMAYLSPLTWDDGGTIEGAVWSGIADRAGAWRLSADLRVAGGAMYGSAGPGVTTAKRYDAQMYLRPELTLGAERALGSRSSISVRGYAAGVFSDTPVLSQRRIFAAGADPYQTIFNPLVRSVGAPLAGQACWCRWHTPGDGNLRGYNPALSSDRMASVNIELTARLLRAKAALASEVRVALFGDGGVLGDARGFGGTGDALLLGISPHRWLADAGPGLRIDQRIGRARWTTRIDLPWFISDPAFGVAHTSRRFDLRRLLVSFSSVVP